MTKLPFAVLLFCTSLATAAPTKSKSNVAVELIGGMNLQTFDYREEIPPPDRSNEIGSFFVFAGALKISSPQLAGFKSFFIGNFEYASQVQTKYEGTVLSSGSTPAGTPAEATDYHNFMRIEANYYFGVHPNVAFHAGYGYRYWKRNLAYGSGYLETYTWSYLPLGILVRNEMGPIEFGLDLTYLVMLSGSIDIVFSENIVGGEDTTLTLGNKNGYRIAIPVSYDLNETVSLQAKPWYEFTEIGKSDQKFNGTTGINSQIHEPASKTEQWGLFLGASIQIM